MENFTIFNILLRLIVYNNCKYFLSIFICHKSKYVIKNQQINNIFVYMFRFSYVKKKLLIIFKTLQIQFVIAKVFKSKYWSTFTNNIYTHRYKKTYIILEM